MKYSSLCRDAHLQGIFDNKKPAALGETGYIANWKISLIHYHIFVYTSVFFLMACIDGITS
jgi:hypothetical protein